MNPTNLAKRKLESSCLTLQDAKRLGIKILSAEKTAKLSPAFPLPSLQICYPDQPVYRLRFLATLPKTVWGTTPKTPRYLQPPNTPPAAYFPPIYNWKELPPGQPILITEGELKAACATKHVLPTIGLGGVWSFRSADRQISFLPELESIHWQDRVVTICFDSDAQQNPQIAAAICQLTKQLRARGALIYVVTIPPLENVPKCGLDDFILHKSVDEFKALLDEATGDELSLALWDFNSRFAFVRTGLVYQESEDMTYSTKNFTDSYGTEWADEITLSPKGEPKSKPVKVAMKWLEWPNRQTFRSLTYIPGAARAVNGQLNTWPGFAVSPHKGDVSPFLTLLKHLFKGDAKAREWFIRWLGYPIAFPGTKLLSAVGMWSEHQGQGKSLIGATVKRIYGSNYQSISQDDLESSFNSWVVGKQFVMVDEMSGQDSRHKADILKKIITEEEILVKKKYVPEYTLPTCANYYLTSNRANAFYLDEKDRRYFIHEVVVEALPPEFYQEYFEWLNGEGPSALLHYFQTLDYQDFKPKERPPMTLAKEAMIESGRSELEAWLYTLRMEPDSILCAGDIPSGVDIYTADQITTIYNLHCVGRKCTTSLMGRQLSRFFPPPVRLRMTKGRARYFIIRNFTKWTGATPEQLRKHLDG